ncbi:hypothetical protein SLS56_012198 [Neofusicoccum ribis]|uniref:Ketoreductase domain-containing protein n=1 Tax=Neofusicoccum ribis TaxID=45134 RepID=A0ABR3S9J6_9PEZI
MPGPFSRGATFTCASISTLYEQDGDALAQFLKSSITLSQQYPKLLIEDPKELSVGAIEPATIAPFIAHFEFSTFHLLLQPDASHLLVGCLGGLGRSLTTMMIEKGARHFTFVSRSGADNLEAARLVQYLKDKGAHVQVFRADASNAADMANVVAEVNAIRLIHGVGNAAMVLQDGLLSAFLSRNRAQSAGTAPYAALPPPAATSLVLPMVLDVGVVAENDALERKIRRKGTYGIYECEMLRGFELAMIQQAQRVNAQMIIGVEPVMAAAALAQSDVPNVYWYHDARFAHVRITMDES